MKAQSKALAPSLTFYHDITYTTQTRRIPDVPIQCSSLLNDPNAYAYSLQSRSKSVIR